MKKMTLAAIAALIGLTACASPIPPSRDAADLANAQAEIARIQALDAVAALPQGTASFVGEIGSELIIDGDQGGAFLGALSLDVNFDTTDVSGSVDDITLYDDGVADQNLGGSLDVTGAFAAGALAATADGNLTAVEESGSFGLSGSTNVNLILTGSLVDDAGTDTLVGDVNGAGTGDFSVLLTGENGFYAR